MKKRFDMKLIFLKQLSIAILLIGLCLVLVQGCQDTGHKDSFRFVFMTDIHVQPELKADQGFRTAIAKVNELKPDFVITGGDLIMDALEQSYERSTNLYDLCNSLCKEFAMPVYHTIGNHEVFGLYEKSGISPDHPEYGKIMFMNRIGNNKTYQSFDYMNWHFMLLDSIGFTDDRHYIGQIDSTQIEWIKNDLKNVDKNTPIIISTHIPFVSVTEQIDKGGTATLPPFLAVVNSNEVLSLFNGYNLKLVLQGHLHIVEEVIYNNTHFVTGGAVCGKWWEGPLKGFPEGFVVVDIDHDDFTWHYQSYGWVAAKDST
jgi:Icc protein